MSDDPVRSLFYHIGLTAVLWAKMEGTLDSINYAIFTFGGGEAIESEVPEALNRKLKYMRKCHKKLPALSSLQPNAETLIDRVNELKQRRHDLVHGIALNYPTGDLLEILTLRRDKQAPRGIRGTKQSVTSADLKVLFDEIFELLELADEHFAAVMDAVFRERRENEGGSLAD